MSAMNNLHLTIQEMLIEGSSPKYIAKVLDIPVAFVYEVMADVEDLTGEDVADMMEA